MQINSWRIVLVAWFSLISNVVSWPDTLSSFLIMAVTYSFIFSNSCFTVATISSLFGGNELLLKEKSSLFGSVGFARVEIAGLVECSGLREWSARSCGLRFGSILSLIWLSPSCGCALKKWFASLLFLRSLSLFYSISWSITEEKE